MWLPLPSPGHRQAFSPHAKPTGPDVVIGMQLLGAGELRTADGREIREVLRQPKRFALLAYLAAATPRGYHRRDRLLGLFWPDLDESRGRNALSQAIHVLRRHLGPDVLVGRGSTDLGLDRAHFRSDVAAFEEAVDGGRHEDALNLYRGDLLDGFFLSGAPESERWVLWINPFDETALRRMVSLLDELGDRSRALRTYNEFAAMMAEELGAKPTPETRALVDRIRERRVVSKGARILGNRRSPRSQVRT